MPVVVAAVGAGMAIYGAVKEANKDSDDEGDKDVGYKYNANEAYSINRSAASSMGDPVYEEAVKNSYAAQQAYDARVNKWMRDNKKDLNVQEQQNLFGARPTIPAPPPPKTDYQAAAQAANAAVQNRAAPTMAAAQLGQAAQAANVQIAANERTANENIGVANQVAAALSGPADQMASSTINRQDLEGRAGQASLVSSLQDQAAGRGPSLASLQLRDAQDRNARQALSVAASLGGNGNSALAMRQAQQAIAAGNQGAANAAAQARIQEQLSAREQLGSQLGNMRAQDIGVNTNQAQLQQDAAAQNMNANNQFTLTNTANRQQAGLANMAALNQRQQEQAAMNLQNAQFNASNQNALNANQANLNQATNLANQNANNAFAVQNATFQQQANANNLNSNLQSQSQKDAMAQYYMNTGVGISEANANRNVTLEQMKTNQSMGLAAQDQAAYQAAEAQKERNVDRIIAVGQTVGSAIAGAAASDETMKKNIRRPSLSDIQSPISRSDENSKTTIETSQGGGFDPDADQKKRAMTVAAVLGGGFKPTVRVPEVQPGKIDWNVLAGNEAVMEGWKPRTFKSDTQPIGNYDGSADLSTISDKRDKNERFYSEGDTRDLLDGIHAHEYEYKDPSAPGAGAGTFVSPMAQELEKTKLGKNMVFEGPDGHKMVDYGKGFGFMMAAMSMLNEKVNELDAKKASNKKSGK